MGEKVYRYGEPRPVSNDDPIVLGSMEPRIVNLRTVLEDGAVVHEPVVRMPLRSEYTINDDGSETPLPLVTFEG